MKFVDLLYLLFLESIEWMLIRFLWGRCEKQTVGACLGETPHWNILPLLDLSYPSWFLEHICDVVCSVNQCMMINGVLC